MSGEPLDIEERSEAEEWMECSCKTNVNKLFHRSPLFIFPFKGMIKRAFSIRMQGE